MPEKVKCTFTVVRFLVEARIDNEDVLNPDTLKDDLENELVKVKSGPYENIFYGDISKVEILNTAEPGEYEVFTAKRLMR